jgi:glc operon protein GlcG
MSATTPNLSDDGLSAALDAAAATGRELGVSASVAIVDAGGHLRAFRRHDGARPATIEAARRKAYTSALSGVSTQVFEERGRGDQAFLTIMGAGFPGGLFLGGGIPIMLDGALAGAVGVSGGRVEQDQAIAEAARAALAHTQIGAD